MSNYAKSRDKTKSNICLRSAPIKSSSYENIEAQCPYCLKKNIYNRISDLNNCMPIGGIKLKCQHHNCNRVFWLYGERTVSAKHKWFLADLAFLQKNKKYGLYIVALCQACEIFMHQAIINNLIDRNREHINAEGDFEGGVRIYKEKYYQFLNTPISAINHSSYAKEPCDTTTDTNNKKRPMNKHQKNGIKYKAATFDQLRTLFLKIFTSAREKPLPILKKIKQDWREKSFVTLQKTDINQMRNNIIHKNACRPSLNQIKKYDELINGLKWLDNYLEIQDTVTYLNKKIYH